MTFGPPREIPRVPPRSHDRAWGAFCGAQFFRVDLSLLPNGFTEPPRWAHFEFGHTGDDTDISAENFVAAAGPQIGMMGFTILAIAITTITGDEFKQLAESGQAAAADAGESPLATIPRPNRAQRRLIVKGR